MRGIVAKKLNRVAHELYIRPVILKRAWNRLSRKDKARIKSFTDWGFEVALNHVETGRNPGQPRRVSIDYSKSERDPEYMEPDETGQRKPYDLKEYTRPYAMPSILPNLSWYKRLWKALIQSWKELIRFIKINSY